MSSLVSIQAVREKLKVSSEAELQVVTSTLSGVISSFEKMTNRLWVRREEFVQRLRLLSMERDSGYINLTLYPVEELTLLEWDTGVSIDDAEEVEAEDLDIDQTRGILTRVVGGFSDNLQITSTGGFTEETCPADVRTGIIEQVKFLYNRLQPGKIDVSNLATEQGGVVTLLRADIHPLFQLAVDNNYRLVR